MQEKPNKKAAIYVRDSSNTEGSEDRLKAQMEKCATHCIDHGVDVTKEYQDTGASRREAFNRMMADATSGDAPFDHIVVWEMNRFSRSAEEAVECQNRLKAHDIQLVSLSEPTSKE